MSRDEIRRSAQAIALPPQDLSQSFMNLVVENSDWLMGPARRMTRNRHDAEDLVQDVLVRAIRFARTFRRGTNFRAWIGRILRNTAINRFRSERIRPRPAVSQGEELALAEVQAHEAVEMDVDALDVAAYAEDLTGELRDAVAGLPKRYREVFLLSSMGDLKHKEIASRLEIPVGTVMSRLFRARALLRDTLGADFDAAA